MIEGWALCERYGTGKRSSRVRQYTFGQGHEKVGKKKGLEDRSSKFSPAMEKAPKQNPRQGANTIMTTTII